VPWGLGADESQRNRLDIDWEYPADHEQAKAYVELLRECREALDQLAARKGRPAGQYQLTVGFPNWYPRRRRGWLTTSRCQVAAPCGSEHMHKLLIAEMDRYLDFWNLMVRRCLSVVVANAKLIM
jgi:chitinase